ncbi:MAG TPA: lipocalin family protein [Burkholderiaceae bacterium]|nr:lipocalin family protein [Burkholderiaceae bacterium]
MNRLRICLIAVALSLAATAIAQPVVTVSHVDLDRYVGHWYEIARYPNRFQAQCLGQVTADYTKLPDNELRVVNRCKTSNGKEDEAIGQARVVDRQTNAKLKVRFAPRWLSFLPWVWGDYWIIDLAPDYSYAVVGDPKREYLWILAREPNMSEPVWLAITQRLGTQGYDPSRLVRTTHP